MKQKENVLRKKHTEFNSYDLFTLGMHKLNHCFLLHDLFDKQIHKFIYFFVSHICEIIDILCYFNQ